MGLMRYNAKGFLDKYEQENQYVFLGNYILPKEQIDYITNGISRTGKKTEKLDELEAEVVAAKIVEKLSVAKGKIKGRVFSNGGSAIADAGIHSEEYQSRNAKVIYTILNIGDVIILEAVGQKDNAMFICRDNDNLREILENFGRKGVLSQGFYKVCHDPKDEVERKYNVDPVLKIMDMATENQELLLNTLEQLKGENKQYSYMKTVESKYYSLAQASKDISKEDVFGSAQKLMSKDIETRDERG